MAELLMEDEAPLGARSIPARELVVGRPRISWGAILAGAFTSLGLWLLLYAFGLAVGLSSIDAGDRGSLKSSGIFTGIWGAIAPLVALFAGGLVAGRASGVPLRSEGAVHGLVMWGITTVTGALMVAVALSALLTGVVTVGKTAVDVGGAAAGAMVGGAGALGLDADDALAPINDRLLAEGKPPITAAELGAATQSVARTAVRQGHLDRDRLVQSLARNTALSRADAEEVADRIEGQWQSAKGAIGGKLESAERGAFAAAAASGKAFWGVFGSLLLGLVAALAGGALGIPRAFARHPHRARYVATPRAHQTASQREVYP